MAFLAYFAPNEKLTDDELIINEETFLPVIHHCHNELVEVPRSHERRVIALKNIGHRWSRCHVHA